MEPVIETNSPLIGDFFRQDIGGMTTRPQTAAIFDLGIRLGAVSLGGHRNHMVDGLKLGPQGGLGFGRQMTGNTSHLIVLRFLPGPVIGLHDVTAVAERRAQAVEKEAREKSNKTNPGDGQHEVEFGMKMEMDSDFFQKLLFFADLRRIFHGQIFPFFFPTVSIPARKTTKPKDEQNENKVRRYRRLGDLPLSRSLFSPSGKGFLSGGKPNNRLEPFHDGISSILVSSVKWPRASVG